MDRINQNRNSAINLCGILRRPPHATTRLQGSSQYPELRGTVMFYQMKKGVLVAAEVSGLPSVPSVFGFHIHEGSSCSTNTREPFADAGEHYNPDNQMHPRHRGDMPPLFGNNGYAFQVFFTDRFRVREVLGKTVIIHGGPDDFTTQPGGNAGTRIACGKIMETEPENRSGY